MNMASDSNAYREFPEVEGGGRWGKWRDRMVLKGFVQQGSSAGVFILKEASSRTEIKKPLNLEHNDGGV